MITLRRLLGVCLMTFAIALPAPADDKKPSAEPKVEKKKAEEKPSDTKAGGAPNELPPDMAAMMAAAQPGPQHEALKPLIGSWKTTNKVWMDPSQPPMESTGTAERKAVLGGRFIQEDYSGNMMNMPFTGTGYTGYDNMAKKYVCSWMDSMSTGIMTMSGQADASGKVFTYMSDQPDPMSGMKLKSVLTIINNDKHTFTMFMVGPDGKDIKSMELEYTRK